MIEAPSQYLNETLRTEQEARQAVLDRKEREFLLWERAQSRAAQQQEKRS